MSSCCSQTGKAYYRLVPGPRGAQGPTGTTGTGPTGPSLSPPITQVVNEGTTSATIVQTQTFTNTGITANITPSSTSSKILILISSGVAVEQNGTNAFYGLFEMVISRTIGGNSSTIGTTESRYINFGGDAWSNFQLDGSFNYMDSPNTTSAVTYTLQVRPNQENFKVTCPNTGFGNITLMEIAS
jgi:hypothetical protein